MKVRPLLLPLLAFVCLLSVLSPVASSNDKSSVNTGFLSPAENDLLAEINLARTQPQQYAAYVEEFKKYYQGMRLLLPGRQRAISTFEGVAAVDDAIAFLRAAQPITPLEAAEPAFLAAKDHALDLIKNGITGHIGSDGTKPNDRVDRYGHWLGSIGEAIVYKTDDTARNNVIGLIIDDGNTARGHRKDLFNPDYHFAGLSISEPGAAGRICVIAYVSGFSKKAAK
jgi:uncharacterized protein YkwD